MDLPDPELRAGQVRVRMLEVGLDGTDADIHRGEYGMAPAGRLHLVLGHEGLGRIQESEEPGLEPGDLVVPMVRRPCPERCLNCRSGEPDMCLTGEFLERGIKGLDGFASTMIVEEPAYLMRVPEALRPVAVLLEPLSVAEKGIREAFRVQERLVWHPRKALVIGAGSLGLLAAFALRLEGLETYVLDRVPQDHPKARRASELGCTYLEGDAVDLRRLDARVGRLDLIIEATGVSAMLFQAMYGLGTNGVLVSFGLSTAGRQLTIPADALNSGFVLANKVMLGSVNSQARDFLKGIDHLGMGMERFPGWLEGLISRKVPLEQAPMALRKDPGDIKVVLGIEA
jgi:threonine dehydrogenase-like Zn-dependent dehydrogenase